MSKRGPEPESEEDHSVKKAKSSNKRRVHVSKMEWRFANAYFKKLNYIGKVKLQKKYNKVIKHSFITIRGKLLALANKQVEGKLAILGKGAFGTVKLAENEEGKDFAIKIESGKKRAFDNQELKVLEKVPNYYHGETERCVPKRVYMGRETDSKLYTLLELLEGKELEKQLEMLNSTQKLLVALKCCLSIRELHQNNIIHADIKPANFMAKIQNNDITIRAIDFGFSMLLKPGQKVIYESGWKGTPDYMAPEIYGGQFSVQSDIYALGIMLQTDLSLPEQLYRNMIKRDPHQRSSLEETIRRLLDALEIIANSDLSLKQQVNEIRAGLTVHQPKPSTGFLAYWRPFYQRMAKVLKEPLEMLYKANAPTFS